MKIEGKRQSEHFEDRGAGGSPSGHSGGRGAAAIGGAGARLLPVIIKKWGWKGVVALLIVGAAVYFLTRNAEKQGASSSAGSSTGSPGGKVCQASEKNGRACEFSRVVLASTEDVWSTKFAAGALPTYDSPPPLEYAEPTLVVFANSVSTDGCGDATSAIGPFYCPADDRLYIDPSFYDTLADRLDAPGDFAQAYVIAHEVGHHIQNLIGSSRLTVPGESKNEVSVRVELQADCFAGVWGHTARASLDITDEDLTEALRAAHSIGDDALGHTDKETFTHGSSEQRKRWFGRGFRTGDPRQCDTFAAASQSEL